MIRISSVLICSCIAVALLGCRGESETYRPSDRPAARASDPESQARAARAEADADNARLEAAEARRKAEKAENDLRLGREAGRASLVSAARAVGIFGGAAASLGVIGLVAGTFFGGVGRKTCLMMILCSGGCVLVRFFIIVYGYAVSQALCWIFIVALVAGTGLCLLIAGRYGISLWTAHGLARKRADNGQDAADAIALLPVPRGLKGPIHDAWEYLADSGPGDPLVEQSARRLLSRFRLPIPAAGADAPASPGQ